MQTSTCCTSQHCPARSETWENTSNDVRLARTPRHVLDHHEQDQKQKATQLVHPLDGFCSLCLLFDLVGFRLENAVIYNLSLCFQKKTIQHVSPIHKRIKKEKQFYLIFFFFLLRKDSLSRGRLLFLERKGGRLPFLKCADTDGLTARES